MNNTYPRGSGGPLPFGFTRKERLRRRAFKYAEARRDFENEGGQQYLNAVAVDNIAYAFGDGYRAAIADLRKEVNKADARMFNQQPAPAHVLARIVRYFLRPLR